MNDPNLHTNIHQALEEYELLEELSPSSVWSEALMHRIETARPASTTTGAGRILLLASLLLVLLNIGSIVAVMTATSRVGAVQAHSFQSSTPGNEDSRGQQLQYLLNELLSPLASAKE